MDEDKQTEISADNNNNNNELKARFVVSLD